ncbi:hypothetical protein BDW74DRAFT_155078 [Aspergillus multicolor]|uniref:uncharacterized protein n=1 Tax=Aspergillus multicolor TaxID=41759 RepID=UPI003CCCEF8B
MGSRGSKPWKFRAQSKRHRDWEKFCVRQSPDGGHVLLVKHWGGFRAMIAENKGLQVGGEGKRGTAWEFVRV